jgi:hypothetical protein
LRGKKLNSTAIELTDPARELANLGQFFLDSANKGDTTDGLTRCFALPADDPHFLEILAAVQHRVRNVESLANAPGESDFDPELRSQVVTATRSFGQLLHPKNAPTPWHQSRATFLPDKHITAIRFFSATARRFRPLRVISEADREEALDRIKEITERLRVDLSLENWMRAALVDGLERLFLVLKHLQFFGHESAVVELLLMHEKISVVEEAVGEAKKKDSVTLRDALLVITLAANLFTLPDQVASAFGRYGGWATTWSNQVIHLIATKHVPAEQRFLPAPAAILSRREDQD